MYLGNSPVACKHDVKMMNNIRSVVSTTRPNKENKHYVDILLWRKNIDSTRQANTAGNLQSLVFHNFLHLYTISFQTRETTWWFMI